jgi:hypothetical protein
LGQVVVHAPFAFGGALLLGSPNVLSDPRGLSLERATGVYVQLVEVAAFKTPEQNPELGVRWNLPEPK